MRTWSDPFLGTIGDGSKDYDDQVFRFEVDDVEIVRPIQYHLLSASIVSHQKIELASETINNDGGIAQSQSLCCSRVKSHFQSFDYASGSTISVDMTFEGEQNYRSEVYTAYLSQLAFHSSETAKLVWQSRPHRHGTGARLSPTLPLSNGTFQ